jgi:hypothetical protein
MQEDLKPSSKLPTVVGATDRYRLHRSGEIATLRAFLS